jgi:hypothetical protein
MAKLKPSVQRHSGLKSCWPQNFQFPFSFSVGFRLCWQNLPPGGQGHCCLSRAQSFCNSFGKIPPPWSSKSKRTECGNDCFVLPVPSSPLAPAACRWSYRLWTLWHACFTFLNLLRETQVCRTLLLPSQKTWVLGWQGELTHRWSNWRRNWNGYPAQWKLNRSFCHLSYSGSLLSDIYLDFLFLKSVSRSI